MRVEPAYGREIEAVLFNPDILDAISEDDSQPSLPDAIYLGGYTDTCIGIFMMIPVSRWVCDVHVHVLPEYRKDHAAEFGKGVIQWAWDHTNFHKLTAQIPFCCQNVKRFARSMGFEVEGINRQSWRKNGQFWDSWYLGLVR